MGAASLIKTFAEGELSEQETRRVGADVFGHLAGLVVAPTVKALSDCGVLKFLDRQAARSVNTRFADLVDFSHADPGYLRVALRLLAGCGWLKQLADEDGAIDGAGILDGLRDLSLKARRKWAILPSVGSAADDAVNAVQKQLRLHLDGLVLGPLMVALSRLGILDRIAEFPVEVEAILRRRSLATHPLVMIGWL